MASERFEEIAETMDFLDDWEDRYRYVIELGKDMAPLEDAFKVPATKVDGCASQVWIMPNIEGEGAGAVLHFRGDSDAMIVKGLIAIIHALYDGETVETAQKIDALGQMARLGLDQHLSSQRSNGLRAMIARIQSLAAAAEGATT